MTVDTKLLPSKGEKVEFEKAMEFIGLGKYHVFFTFLCCFIGMSMLLETAGMTYILPSSQCDLQLTITQKGLLGATPYIGIILMCGIWGYLADTYGRRKILLISSFFGSICSILSSLSPNATVMLFARLVTFLILCAANSINVTYYGEFIPKKYTGPMISVIVTTNLFSTTILSFLAWGILSLNFDIPMPFLGISYKPWRLLMLVYALPYLISAICLLKAPESPKFLLTAKREKEALEVLGKIYALNTGHRASEFPINSLTLIEQNQNIELDKNEGLVKKICNQIFPLFKPPLLKSMIIFIILNIGIHCSISSLFIWLPVILNKFFNGLDAGLIDNKTICEILNLENNEIGTAYKNITNDVTLCSDKINTQSFPVLVTFSAIFAIINLSNGVILKYVQKKWTIIVVFGICFLSAFLLNWVHIPTISIVLVLMLNITGVLMTTVCIYTLEIFPTQYRSRAFGITLIFGKIGAIAGINLIGHSIVHYCPATFFGYSIVFMISLISSFFLPWQKKDKCANTEAKA